MGNQCKRNMPPNTVFVKESSVIISVKIQFSDICELRTYRKLERRLFSSNSRDVAVLKGCNNSFVVVFGDFE